MMLENQMAANPTPSHPASADDVASNRTQWTPLKKEGTYFKTHDLHVLSEQRFEFRPTRKLKLLQAAIFPLIFTAACVVGYRSLDPNDLFGVIFSLSIGTIVGTLAHLLVRQMMTPITFNIAAGYYCKSRKIPEQHIRPESIDGFFPLDRIHALQILPKETSVKYYAYTSYELNLVLTDGTRHNVIDHSHAPSIYSDAQHIATALKIPIWDAS